MVRVKSVYPDFHEPQEAVFVDPGEVRKQEFRIAHAGLNNHPQTYFDSLRARFTRLEDGGDHLWDKSEYEQIVAAATWMAGARTVLAGLMSQHMLDSSRTHVSDQSFTVLEHQYLMAERWVEFRDDVGADPAFRLVGKFDSSYAWPDSATTQIAPELFEALASVCACDGEHELGISQLIDIYLPETEKPIGGPNMHPYFKRYVRDLEKKKQDLAIFVESLRSRWRPGMDPNTDQGRSYYDRLVKAVEMTIELGVNRLFPASYDPDLRLTKTTTSAAAQDTPILPLFDPRAIPRVSVQPVIEAFDPAMLLQPSRQRAEPLTPTLPAFDPRIFGEPQRRSMSADREPSLPIFDPVSLVVGTRVPLLPEFDPSLLMGSKESDEGVGPAEVTPAASTQVLPLFDPKMLR